MMLKRDKARSLITRHKESRNQFCALLNLGRGNQRQFAKLARSNINVPYHCGGSELKKEELVINVVWFDVYIEKKRQSRKRKHSSAVPTGARVQL